MFSSIYPDLWCWGQPGQPKVCGHVPRTESTSEGKCLISLQVTFQKETWNSTLVSSPRSWLGGHLSQGCCAVPTAKASLTVSTPVLWSDRLAGCISISPYVWVVLDQNRQQDVSFWSAFSHKKVETESSWFPLSWSQTRFTEHTLYIISFQTMGAEQGGWHWGEQRGRGAAYSPGFPKYISELFD